MERDEFLRAAWKAMVAEEIDARSLVFLRMRWAPTHIAFSFVRLGQEGREGLLFGTPQPRPQHDAALKYERGRDGTIACR